MDTYETNLNRIKEDIKAGKMIGKTVSENQEIQSLYNELLDFNSEQRTLQKRGITGNVEPFEIMSKIDQLARRLNYDFVSNQAANDISNALSFYDEVEKLPAMEQALFNDLEKRFGNQAFEVMKKNNMNVYITEANLNGFDDFVKFIEHKNKAKDNENKMTLSESEVKNLEFKETLKAAIIEALKELNIK